jgi:hypothetical protein
LFCNVHIIYGQEFEDRVNEIDAIVNQLALKVERGRDFPPNLVFLGDVQGGSVGGKGQILETIEDAGFVLPSDIRDLPTNTLGRGRPYDQIALLLSSDLELEPDKSGVIDYYQIVYTEDQAELYIYFAGEDWTIDEFPRRRTYWMSDRLPKWLSLQVHNEAE